MSHTSRFTKRLIELTGSETASQLLQEFSGCLISIPRGSFIQRLSVDEVHAASENHVSVLYAADLARAASPYGCARLLQALATAHAQNHHQPAYLRLTLGPLPELKSVLSEPQSKAEQSSAPAPENCGASVDAALLRSRYKSEDSQAPAPSPSVRVFDNSLNTTLCDSLN